MFCYCGGELKLLSNKNFVCNKCSTVFKECEDGIYSDNNSLYKIYFIDSSYEECLIPIETKQEYNEYYDEDYDKTIIFAPKLGYAIKLEKGYIVTVNDDSFYTNLANDFHVKCDDYFKLDKDTESKWFRKQKLVHQAVLKNEDAFPPD